MNREIVMPRKKSKIIGVTLLFLGVTFMLTCNGIVTVATLCNRLDALEKAPWLVMFALPTPIGLFSALCAPFTFLVSIYYFKQLFNPHPLLTVNAQGIDEHMSRKPVGLIRWEDIEDVHIVPYIGKGNLWIAIFLKDPRKYIQDERELAKANKTAAKRKLGHVFFSSLDFPRNQLNDIIDTMQHYLAAYRKEIKLEQSLFS